MRIVISGYYGSGNAGDEAVLASMLAALRARLPGAEYVVLSADPPATARLHRVAAVSRTGIGAVRAIAGADLLISGGGSLIQDATSARSALYYLGVLGLATVLARRTMVFAQGIGPLRRRWIRVLARWVLNRVDLITLRDEDSRRLVAELGVHRPSILVADPVFAMDAAPATRAEEILRGAARPRIGVAVRPLGDDRYLSALIDGLAALRAQTGASIVALVFHPAYDEAMSAAVSRATGGRVIAGLPPQEMMAVIGALDLLVGIRLHALICAVATGVAQVGLSYDPKVEALFRRVGVGQLLPLSGLQPAPVRQALMSAWGSREAVRPRLLAVAASLREDALRAADLAAALVRRNSIPPYERVEG